MKYLLTAIYCVILTACCTLGAMEEKKYWNDLTPEEQQKERANILEAQLSKKLETATLVSDEDYLKRYAQAFLNNDPRAASSIICGYFENKKDETFTVPLRVNQKVTLPALVQSTKPLWKKLMFKKLFKSVQSHNSATNKEGILFSDFVEQTKKDLGMGVPSEQSVLTKRKVSGVNDMEIEGKPAKKVEASNQKAEEPSIKKGSVTLDINLLKCIEKLNINDKDEPSSPLQKGRRSGIHIVEEKKNDANLIEKS